MPSKPKATPIKKRSNHKGGKPRKLDDQQCKYITELAAIGHTAEEIGPFLNIHPTAITTTYRAEYLLGMNQMKNSLRHAQFVKGVKDGNVTMLIWLGKQHLGQTDLGPLNPGDNMSEVEMTITTIKKTKTVKKDEDSTSSREKTDE